MDLRIVYDGAEYLTLQAFDYASQKSASGPDWGTVTELNDQGEVILFEDVRIRGDWNQNLDKTIGEVRQAPPVGTYTLKALGIEDKPFVEVILAVQSYIVGHGSPLRV
jgi:hypothetical protein